jgi:hypothetical protein
MYAVTRSRDLLVDYVSLGSRSRILWRRSDSKQWLFSDAEVAAESSDELRRLSMECLSFDTYS